MFVRKSVICPSPESHFKKLFSFTLYQRMKIKIAGRYHTVKVINSLQIQTVGKGKGKGDSYDTYTLQSSFGQYLQRIIFSKTEDPPILCFRNYRSRNLTMNEGQ